MQNAIALSSTVFALFLRQVLVLSITAQEDVDDEQIIATLREHVNKATAELHTLSISVKTFRTTVHHTKKAVSGSGQVIKDAVGEVAGNLKTKAQEISNVEIDQKLIAKQMAEAAKLALARVDAEITALGEALRTRREEVLERAKAVADELRELADTITEGAQSSAAALTGFQETIVNHTEGAGSSLSDLKGAIDSGKGELGNELLRLKATLETGGENSKQAIDSLTNVIESGGTRVDSGFQDLAEKIGTNAFEEFNAEFGRAIDRVVIGISEDSGRIHQSLEELVKTFGDTNAAIGGNAEDVKRLSKEFTKYSDALGTNQEALKLVTEGFGRLTQELSGTAFDPDWLKVHSDKLTDLSANLAELRTSLEKMMSEFRVFTEAENKDGAESERSSRLGRAARRFLRWLRLRNEP